MFVFASATSQSWIAVFSAIRRIPGRLFTIACEWIISVKNPSVKSPGAISTQLSAFSYDKATRLKAEHGTALKLS
jgi:hypothetical protein